MEDPAPSTSQSNLSTNDRSIPRMALKMGKKIRSRKAKDQPNLLLESVLHSLRTCLDGNELQALVSALASPARVVEKEFNSLQTDLMGVLKFPDNQPSIYEFGSIRSGLLFRDSDLDFYISFAKGKIEREEQIKLIHTVCGRMIRKGTFKDITKIWRAKLPLLRAVHVVTNRKCDINFSNDRGWYNSMFLRAVMRFDPRIHQLAVIIKFWARCAHMFTVQKQMNSYCLVMMLIFFLQTHELPVLPSVEDMQKGIPRINDGAWNFAYPVQIEYKTWNVNTVRELLVSFFKFYAEFDFGKNLISPFVGRLCSLQELEKKTIRELATYYRAVEREDYPELSCGPFLTIQDPFELNVNVGKVLRMKMLYEQLTLSFRHAYDVCQAHQGKKFSDLLIALFTDTKRHQKTKGKNKNKTNYFHPNFIDTNVHQETKGQNKIKPNNFHPNFTDTKRHQKTKGQNKIKPNNFHPNFIDRSRYRIIDALCILRDLPMIVWVYCFIFLFSVGTFWFVEWVVDIFVANPKYWLIFPLLCIFIRPQTSTASINGLCFMLSILLIIATIGKMLAANYVISIYGLYCVCYCTYLVRRTG